MFHRENGQFKRHTRQISRSSPLPKTAGPSSRWWRLPPLRCCCSLMNTCSAPFSSPFILSLWQRWGEHPGGLLRTDLSLGSGAFMAVGAHMAYNTLSALKACPIVPCCLEASLPPCRHVLRYSQPAGEGAVPAVATLAAQFFCDWAFLRIGWFTNNNSSGSVSVSNLQVFRLPIETPAEVPVLPWLSWLCLPCWPKPWCAVPLAMSG